MKHNAMLKTLAVLALFFATTLVVSAQSAQTVAEPPSSEVLGPDPDESHPNYQGPQSVLQKNNAALGYDDNKYAAWQQQLAQDALPHEVDEEAIESMEAEMKAAGYDPIPGFVLTGNKAIDDANYMNARIDLQTNNPALFDQLFRQ